MAEWKTSEWLLEYVITCYTLRTTVHLLILWHSSTFLWFICLRVTSDTTRLQVNWADMEWWGESATGPSEHRKISPVGDSALVLKHTAYKLLETEWVLYIVNITYMRTDRMFIFKLSIHQLPLIWVWIAEAAHPYMHDLQIHEHRL